MAVREGTRSVPMLLVSLGYGIAADSGRQGYCGQGNEPDPRTSSYHVSYISPQKNSSHLLACPHRGFWTSVVAKLIAA